jgi:hypothetical protein
MSVSALDIEPRALQPPAVLKSTLRIWSTVGAMLFLFGVPAPGHPASEQDAPAAKPAEAGKAAGDAQATPPAGAPADDEKMKAELAAQREAGCKKASSELGASGAGVDSLSKEQRAQLVASGTGQDLLICLAIANGKPGGCDPLTDKAKETCVAQFELAKDMRGVPKERLKGRVIHRLCMEHQLCERSGKSECDDFESAVNTGDSAKCGSLAEPTRKFCTAVASRDAAKCSGFPEPDSRKLCEAFTTEDVDRCPAESADCKELTSGFAAFRKQGLGGMQEIDAGLAAAAIGRDACKPLLAKFEKACIEAQ